jgi:hypothetical protein
MSADVDESCLGHLRPRYPASPNQPSKLFTPETWEEDRQKRFLIEPLTALFHRAVPSLCFLNWRIYRIERGFAETCLPLNVASSNQFITQQAALMLLSADYTGGIALSTLFRGVPVIGFHAQDDDYGAYIWVPQLKSVLTKPDTHPSAC